MMLVFRLLKNSAFLLAGLVLTVGPAMAAPRLPVGDEIVVWVKFTDRGPLEDAPAEVRRQAARSQVSERSLERRLRRAGLTEPLASDLPVYDGYIEELRARGLPVRAVSRWLNAASVVIAPERLPGVKQLPFVAGVQAVDRYRVRRPDEFEPVPRRTAPRLAPSGKMAVTQVPGDPYFYAG